MRIKATLSKLPDFNRNFYFFLLISLLIFGCSQKEDDSQSTSDSTQGTVRGLPRAWTQMGRNSASSGGISNTTSESLYPDITINGNNNPYVCWASYYEEGPERQFEIYTKHWNGTSWVEISNNSASGNGISKTIGNSTNPQIVISRTDNPIICWREEVNQSTPSVGQIYVKQWDDTNWIEMGRNSASDGGISQNEKYSSAPSITLDLEGYPIICWGEMMEIESQIHIRRWNGYAWARIKEIIAEIPKAASSQTQIFPAVVQPKVAATNEGNPIVCWADYSRGNYEIYVKEWDGQAWLDMGSDSASKSGISGSPGQSINPDITVDRDGVPMICWQDDTNGNSEIYVRRWNNYEWVQMGQSSASSGGISDDEIQSSMPRISVDRENSPVISWTAGNDIYVKYWNGSSWIETAQGSASKTDNTETNSVAGTSAI
ncbi:hypothetical protein ACFLZ8_03000, partial [Planctomycetota bacterium]